MKNVILAAAFSLAAPLANATTIVNTGSDSGGFKTVLDWLVLKSIMILYKLEIR